MSLRSLYTLLLCLMGLATTTQAQHHLTFLPQFQNQPLQLNQPYPLGDSSHPIQITQLKYYLHNIQLYLNQQLVYTLPETYYLLDLENPSSLQFDLPTGVTYDRVAFGIGVDSLTNAQGVSGGALDPMHGMYWTWQSGYINFKLEGTSALCSSRGQEFQFHIGGFLGAYCPYVRLNLAGKAGTALKVGLDVEKLLLWANLRENDHIMSPNQRALDFAQLFPLVFSIL